MANIVSTQIRFPRKLHNMLKTEAKKNFRSLNAEIIKRLADTLNLETEDESAKKVVRVKF